MGRKFLLSLTVLKKTCACGTLSSLDGEVSGRACSYKYGPVLDLNGASRSRRSSLPWNWARAQRTGWRLGLGRRRAGINSQWFRGSTRSGGRRPLPSGRNFTVGFTSRVAHCAAPAAHAVERRPPPFLPWPQYEGLPTQGKGASFTGSRRSSSLSGLWSAGSAADWEVCGGKGRTILMLQRCARLQRLHRHFNFTGCSHVRRRSFQNDYIPVGPGSSAERRSFGAFFGSALG
ncbi:hypothetical protein PF003_g22971 [Phytophthora fragariae]|nr:hypothetical protein PF003_g22971 [Phytophthora fragariae]